MGSTFNGYNSPLPLAESSDRRPMQGRALDINDQFRDDDALASSTSAAPTKNVPLVQGHLHPSQSYTIRKPDGSTWDGGTATHYEYHHGKVSHSPIPEYRPSFSWACCCHHLTDFLALILVVGFMAFSGYVCYYVLNNFGGG